MTDYTPFKKEMTYRMVKYYCLNNHGGKVLCEECRALLKRSEKHLDECRYKKEGYACPACPHCCYGSDREIIQKIVSYENTEPADPEYASKIFAIRGIDDISEAEREYDPRYNLKRNALKKAFLDVIIDTRYADITVSQLCKKASVSRSTFYSHYPAISDLADDCIFDLILQVDMLPSQIKLPQWPLPPAGEPMCIFLRRNPDYRAMVFDPDLTDHCIDLMCECSGPRIIHTMMKHNRFDITNIMASCNTAARGCVELIRRNIYKSDEEWEEIKKRTDSFYCGGMRLITLD